MGQSIEIAVKNTITDHGRGWCFTPMHFSDLGRDASIRKALSQLQKQNVIRRLAQGNSAFRSSQSYKYPLTGKSTFSLNTTVICWFSPFRINIDFSRSIAGSFQGERYKASGCRPTNNIF